MRPIFLRAMEWLERRAENIAALLLLTMFVAFLLQILFRYALGLPTGWSHELTVTTWLWLILFGSTFVVKEETAIRLDLIYSASPASVRRLMTVVSSAVLVFLFAISLPAILDFVLFMKVQRTAYLRIRFDWLFSIYIVFAVGMMVRYLWLGAYAIWGPAPRKTDLTQGVSGV